MSGKVDDYRLLEELGEGVAGKVHLAVLTKDKAFGKTGDLFAFKQYKPEFLSDKKQYERIIIEATVGTEISHPNIVRVVDSCTKKENPFIVMEYIDGITLNDWINMFYPIPEQWIYSVLEQLAKGLAELHSREINHRDIKPDNIMLTSDFEVKIMDLGVIQIPHKPDLTPKGKLLGTIRNASPNVLKGEDYTDKDDIYSLGTVAYTMLHGYQLFSDEDNELKLQDKVCNDEIVYQSEKIRKASTFCNRLLKLTKKMLSKNIESRPDTIEEVRESLGEIKEFLPTTSSAPLHGYIASSLTGLEDDTREAVAFSSKLIADVSKGYNIYAHQPRKVTDPILNKDIEPGKVYYLDRKRILYADLLIVIANYPSFGVGQELEIASSFGTPTVLITREGKKISRMVKGGFINLIGDITYSSPEDLEKKLNKCLNDNHETIKNLKNIKQRSEEFIPRGELSKIRKALAYSLEDVSLGVGISKNFLQAIEDHPNQYHNCSFIILKLICDYYEVDLNNLLLKDAPVKKPALQDSNIRRLESVAKKIKMAAEHYYVLRDEYFAEQTEITEEAAKDGSPLVITEQDWITRYNKIVQIDLF